LATKLPADPPVWQADSKRKPVSLFTRVYMWACVCTRVPAHRHSSRHRHTHTHTVTNSRTHWQIHTKHTFTHVHTCSYTHTHLRAHTYTYTSTHTYTYPRACKTYIHIHEHTHTYTYPRACQIYTTYEMVDTHAHSHTHTHSLLIRKSWFLGVCRTERKLQLYILGQCPDNDWVIVVKSAMTTIAFACAKNTKMDGAEPKADNTRGVPSFSRPSDRLYLITATLGTGHLGRRMHVCICVGMCMYAYMLVYAGVRDTTAWMLVPALGGHQGLLPQLWIGAARSLPKKKYQCARWKQPDCRKCYSSSQVYRWHAQTQGVEHTSVVPVWQWTRKAASTRSCEICLMNSWLRDLFSGNSNPVGKINVGWMFVLVHICWHVSCSPSWEIRSPVVWGVFMGHMKACEKVQMYVCMYVCMHVCMYVCMYVYIHWVWLGNCAYACSVYACMYVYMHGVWLGKYAYACCGCACIGERRYETVLRTMDKHVCLYACMYVLHNFTSLWGLL
jgi:hypothetical protein